MSEPAYVKWSHDKTSDIRFEVQSLRSSKMGCDIYYSTCLKVTREEKIRDASKMDTLNGKERSDKNR